MYYTLYCNTRLQRNETERVLNTLYRYAQATIPQRPARDFRPQIKAAGKKTKKKGKTNGRRAAERDRVYDVLEKCGTFAVGEFQQAISLANKRFVILYIILLLIACIIATISVTTVTTARSRWRHNFFTGS